MQSPLLGPDLILVQGYLAHSKSPQDQEWSHCDKHLLEALKWNLFHHASVVDERLFFLDCTKIAGLC